MHRHHRSRRLAITLALILGMTVTLSLRRYLHPPLARRDRVAVALYGLDLSRTRADVIAVAVVNLRHRRLAILRCPRDTWVRFAGERRRRLNSLYAQGRLTGWLESQLGVKIDRTVALGFQEAAALVEPLCPLTVDCGKEVVHFIGDRYGPWGPGEAVLHTGEEVVAFVRARGTFGSKQSDLWRIDNQHRVQQALIARLKGLRDPRVVLRIARVWEEKVHSDLTIREMVALAWGLRSLKQEDVRSVWLPGHFAGAGWALDKRILGIEMRRRSFWLAGREGLGLRIIARDLAQGQALGKRLALDQGVLFLGVEAQPRLPTGTTFLIVPAGQSARTRQRIQQLQQRIAESTGSPVTVSERWDTEEIVLMMGS